MSEQELPFINITDEDIVKANQLSLHCPICSSAVENHVDGDAVTPVVCAKCGTLYHKACWEQSGGKCAVLGCEHDKYLVHGRDYGPAIKVDYADIPKPSVNGRSPSARTRRLKEQQKRDVERMSRPGFWQRVWQWLLDQIKVET